MKKIDKKNKEVAISVHNVSKSFKLYHEKRGSIRDFFYHLGKGSSYEKFEALKNINFEVNKGEFLGIIGRNGSGKSTLLKLLAGVYLPDSGHVKVNGRLIPFLELGVGFNPELTGRENVFLNGTIMGLTKKELEIQFDEIVDFAEVREFIDMPLKKYSSGMQVRLAFSIAIKADADIYLLDEILAVGDANFQAKSMAQFRKFKERGKTVILVTHDLSAVNQYCDKAIYIKDHEIYASGKPSDLIDKYIYEDRDNNPNELSGTENNENDSKTKKNIISVKQVKFIDKKNTPNNIFVSGDPMQIKILFKLKEKIKTPVFGVAMYRDDGSHVLGDTSMWSDLKLKELDKGDHEITLKIESLNLLRGNILMSIAVADPTLQNHYLWEDKKYSFSVITSKPQDGLIRMDTAWSIKS